MVRLTAFTISFKCPRCHEAIYSRKGKCESCGLIFDEKTQFSCPLCGALFGQLDSMCPGCKTTITSGEAVPIYPWVVKEEKTPEPKSRPIPQKITSKTISVSSLQKPKPQMPGRVNGLGRGLTNGLKVESSKTPAGMINGLRVKPAPQRQMPSIFSKRIIGKIQLWQITAIAVTLVIILSAFVVMISNANSAGITIDGQFDDWSNIPDYDFSRIPSNLIEGFTHAKIQSNSEKLFLCFGLRGSILSSTADTSAVYAFVDLDAKPNTGYRVNDQLGAEWLGKLVQYEDESTVESSGFYFDASYDTDDWNGWTAGSMPNWDRTGQEIEISMSSSSVHSIAYPNVQLISVSNKESATPIISKNGTIIAIQSTLLSSDLMSSTSQLVLNLSMTMMGRSGETYIVTPSLINISGFDTELQELSLSPGLWTSIEIEADTSSLQNGDSLVYSASINPGTFVGPIQILGEPARGYYLAYPSEIEIDGIFNDWAGKTIIDQDPILTDNPNINIEEFAATSNQDHHFFYVNVEGQALKGSGVPEKREKSIPGPPSPPGERIRITGQDQMQAYIDIDPGNLTGRFVVAGNSTIRADYLINISGRNGKITSESVMEWSESSLSWASKGNVRKASVSKDGLEYSVDKFLLGNLSGSQTIYFISDWTRKSDFSLVGDALKDPFRLNLTGKIWRSLDGTSWVSVTDVLSGGSNAIDITSDSSDNVYVLFQNGTVYKSTDLGQSWNRQISASLSGVDRAIAFTCDRSSYLYLLTQKSMVFYADTSATSWSNRGNMSSSNGWVDIDWADGTMPSSTTLYALKWQGGKAYYQRSLDGGANWDSSTEVALNGTGTASAINARGVSSYTIYILESDGDLRISNNSGSTWSTTHISPGGSSNFTNNPCVDLDSDSNNDIWVIRNQGEVYKLTISPWGWSTLYSTGNVAEIQAISTTPIPEFGNGLLIAIIIVPIIVLTKRRRKLD